MRAREAARFFASEPSFVNAIGGNCIDTQRAELVVAGRVAFDNGGARRDTPESSTRSTGSAPDFAHPPSFPHKMDAASGSGFESDAKHSSSAAAKQSTRALDVVSGPRVQASYRRLARSGSASRAAGHPELNVDYKCSPPLQEDPRSTGRTVADSVSQQSTALSSAAAAAPGPTGYRGLLTLMHARMTRKQRAQPISRAEIAALLSHELGRLDWTDLLGHLQADDERFEVQIATKRFEHAAQALSELADAATASSTGGAAAVPGELPRKGEW